MFRVSQFMREIVGPTPIRPPRAPSGPVVIWNLIRRCNLTCKHCYSISGDVDFPGELATAEVYAVMDDLKAFGVPVLILSGGEPLLRADIFDIAARAKAMGFYVGLSTNGTLIDDAMAARIATVGFDYVGISLDGLGATHDRFRRRPGAFAASLRGVRLCRAAGIKVGLRFTLVRDNAADLPGLLDLMERERVDKFYLSHLNYGGRGNKNRGEDAAHRMTRAAMDLLFERAHAAAAAGRTTEFVTGNNDADGVYLLRWVEERFPDRAQHVRACLVQWGGNASGVAIANIDNLGDVHPDTFWWHHRLGNVRERPFSAIWSDLSDPLLAGLRARPRAVTGRCGVCPHIAICNGNTRVRAHQLTGDPWAEDPGCYLDDDELGIAPRGERLAVTPFRGRVTSMRPLSPVALGVLLAVAAASPGAAEDATALFAEHCAACHGANRLGASGPALLPESLARLKPEAITTAILEGRAATQMPPFAGVLDDQSIAALATFVMTPPVEPPTWTLADMVASRVVRDPAVPLVAAPVHDADPLGLFVVVEAGDHHVTVLDGATFRPVTRFASRFALHGGPKFTADGRYVFFASRDGWITKYDLWGLEVVAEIRAGLNTRNLAIAEDGGVVMVANTLPRTLVALSGADLAPLAVIPAVDRDGTASRVSAVYQAAPRASFVVALKDVPELWEIPYGAGSRRVFQGFVHNWEEGMVEGMADQEPFPIRRIALDAPLDDFFFTPDYRFLVGASRAAGGAQVVNLNVGRVVATIAMPGLPHLGSGIAFDHRGRTVLATPNLGEPTITVVATDTWDIVGEVATDGPGFFLRSHESTPFAWADQSMGPERDTIAIIDKATLAVVGHVTPSPGKLANHVEFSAEGRYALVSVSEPSPDGALVVYDAATFAEVARLPMNKPVGKYNVFNKITRSSGTSH